MAVFRQRQAVIRLRVRVLSGPVAGPIEDMIPLDIGEGKGRPVALPGCQVRESSGPRRGHAGTIDFPPVERVGIVGSDCERNCRLLLYGNATRWSQRRVFVAVGRDNKRLERVNLSGSFTSTCRRRGIDFRLSGICSIYNVDMVNVCNVNGVLQESQPGNVGRTKGHNLLEIRNIRPIDKLVLVPVNSVGATGNQKSVIIIGSLNGLLNTRQRENRIHALDGSCLVTVPLPSPSKKRRCVTDVEISAFNIKVD